MSREFEVSAGGLTLVSAVVTLANINPPAAPGPNIEILRCTVSQSQNATSNQQRVQLVTQVTAFPTLVSATPQALKRWDANASVIVGGTTGAAGKAGVNASSEGGGTRTVIKDEAFNVLNGWLWVPTPRETIVLPSGSLSSFSIFFPVAAQALGNWAVSIVYAEV
jgi:hypothetical protein